MATRVTDCLRENANLMGRINHGGKLGGQIHLEVGPSSGGRRSTALFLRWDVFVRPVSDAMWTQLAHQHSTSTSVGLGYVTDAETLVDRTVCVCVYVCLCIWIFPQNRPLPSRLAWLTPLASLLRLVAPSSAALDDAPSCSNDCSRSPVGDPF